VHSFGRRRLGDILVDLQVLTPAEVERVLDAMRRRPDQRKFGQVARDLGLLGEEHVLAALAVQLEMFPGIQGLSLRRLLERLQAPLEAPAKTAASTSTPLPRVPRPFSFRE
jgi:hypothetical protein